MNKIIMFLAVALLTIPTSLFAAQSQNLESLLLEAASAGQTDIVKSFLDNGANIEIKNDVGATPLIFASAKGQKEVVTLLLERRANVNAKTTTGITPLMAAASGGYPEIVKLLLAKGADVSAKDQQGRNAFSMAEASGESQVVDLLKSAQTSSMPEQSRVASQDRSSSRQRSRDRSDPRPVDSDFSGPSDSGPGYDGPMAGQSGGLMSDPVIGQMLSRVLGGQQSGPGPVAAVQNPDMQVNVQNQPPAQGPNAPNQPPGQAGNAPNQPPGQAGNAPNQPPGQAGNAPNQPPGQANDPNVVVTHGMDPGGIEWTKSFSRTTGETQVSTTQKDTQRGWITETNTTLDASGKIINGTQKQTVPGPNEGQSITNSTMVDGKWKITSSTEVSAKGNSSTTWNYDPKTGMVASKTALRPNGSSTTTNYTGHCFPDGAGCKLVSSVDRDLKTGKQTTTTYDKEGKVIGTQVSDIPKDQQQNAAMLRAGKKPQGIAADKLQGVKGNKLQGLAGQKGQTGAKEQVKADVLKKIGSKPSGDLKDTMDKLKTTGVAGKMNKSGAAADLNPQPLPPGPPPDKLIGKPKLEDKFTGIKPHVEDKFKTGANKKEDFNKQATTHGANFKERVVPQTQSSKQFSEGIKYKTQNMPLQQFKGKTTPQNFNQPAGGQQQKWNR